MSLKDLSLYRASIEESVKGFPGYLSHKVDKLPNDRYNFIIDVKGQKYPAMINIINLQDGNTTLNTTVGKNKELSNEISEHISKCCQLPIIPSKNLYLKEMSDEDFASFLEYVDAETELSITGPRQLKNAEQYQLSWIEGGHVHINWFKTKAFSVQGNSNHVKEKILEILTQVLPFEDVITAQLESLEVNITTDQVLAETETLMPLSFSNLGDTVIAIISPSIAFKTLDIELTDYSAFTFPVLRAIEGVLKLVFQHFGINFGENIGSVYDRLDNGSYELQTAHRAVIPSVGILRLINELYNMYHSERHTIFHTNILVQTSRVVEDKEEAVKIIDDGIGKIEELFTQMKNANIQTI